MENSTPNGSDGNTNVQGQLRTAGRKINQQGEKGDQGVYNHNPNPGLDDPAATGVIDIKFAETDVGTAGMMKNKMRSPVVRMKDLMQNPGSGIQRRKNQTRSMGMTKQIGK